MLFDKKGLQDVNEFYGPFGVHEFDGGMVTQTYGTASSSLKTDLYPVTCEIVFTRKAITMPLC